MGDAAGDAPGDAGEDGWLTFTEAAVLLGRSHDTLRMQRRLHALQTKKRAGVWMTRLVWVEAYRRAHLGRKGWAARLDEPDAAAAAGDAVQEGTGRPTR